MKKLLSILLSVFSLTAFAQTKKVAILEVVDRYDNMSYKQKMMLRSNIARTVANTAGYEAYVRSDVDAEMAENEFQRTGQISDDQIRQIGNMTGVSYILVTEGCLIGTTSVFVTVKLFNVEKGIEKIENIDMGLNAADMQHGCVQIGQKLFDITATFPATEKYNNIERMGINGYTIDYFSNYAKPIVESAINEWQSKDEFEKIADWRKRVNEETRNAKIKELTKKCEQEYIDKYTSVISLKVSLDGLYDSENEVFLLYDPIFGNMIVSVPITEARAFKQNWDSAQITPKYFIENDVLALASLDIYFPSSQKRYTYSNKASLKYEQAQVDYNFEAIEIAQEDSSGPKGEQIIGKRNITAGRSQVDINIPEINTTSPNTFVVIIANEDYKSVAPVPFALNDGRTFAKYCQRTLGVPAVNIKIHENATYNDIRLALAWLKVVCEKYEGEASVIFYYAGHGIPDVSDKSAYLLPVDGDGRYVSTGYKLDDLYQKLGGMPTKSTTVLLDACFSGSNRDGKMLASERGVALKAKAGVPQGNIVVFSAAQSDETALPNEEEGHGMFTYYILKKLQETNGDVTLQDLSQYVIREVGRKSAVTNKAQTPCVIPSATVGSKWQDWKLKP